MNHCMKCEAENLRMTKEKGYGRSYLPPLSDCLDHGPKSEIIIGTFHRALYNSSIEHIRVKNINNYGITFRPDIVNKLINENKKVYITWSKQSDIEVARDGFIKQVSYEII